MQIHIQRDGITHGPYSPEAVRQLIGEGTFQPSDLAWREGMEAWIPLASIPGIGALDSPGPTLASPRTPALAIWSLVLGILGMFSLGLTSIPAIICGHLSHGRIRKSAGSLTGQGLAIAGFVLGYISLVVMPLLIVAGFTAGNAAIVMAKKVTALAQATAIESAVNHFHTEYGAMPSTIKTADTTKDVSLVKTLHGDDPTLNPRNVRFLSVREARSHKNGLDPVTFKMFDPWGRGYQVILDTQSKEDVVVKRGARTEKLSGRRVAVYSLGEDGVSGTADDVMTW